MGNPKQIRPEWVPLAYREKAEDVKKQVLKVDVGNGFAKKGMRKGIKKQIG